MTDAWSEGLMCRWITWRAVDDFHLVLTMPKNNVCDMRGAIKAARALCPTVRRIDTVQDGKLDMVYFLDGDRQWVAKDASAH